MRLSRLRISLRVLPLLAAALIATAPARAADAVGATGPTPSDRGLAKAGAREAPESAGSAPAVHPLPLDGAELVRGIEICRQAGVTAERVSDYRACNGYIAGIIVGVSAMADLGGVTPPFCIPDGTDDAAIHGAVQAFLNTHKEASTWSVPAFVIGALVSAWPCDAPERQTHGQSPTQH